jgi:hypothetical protein
MQSRIDISTVIGSLIGRCWHYLRSSSDAFAKLTVKSAPTRGPQHIILAGPLLLGIGYLAILPPFEAFDEYAYYSSIRQFADTETLAIFGSSYIDRNAEDYEAHAPMPWTAGSPPFEQPGRMTYPAFFGDQSAITRYETYRTLPANKDFTPGVELNWEAQHPPLYYVLMAPIMKATETFSFVTQVFTLRLVSYVLAWAGFVIGWRAIRSYQPRWIPAGIADGYVYYPLFVPMFLGEFARIGNDALCLLLLSLIFCTSLAVFYQEKRSAVGPVTLGILLGLGLLTKAFFIPLTAGYAAFMLLRTRQARNDKIILRERLRTAVLTIALALLIGGGWYVRDFIEYGSPLGSLDSVVLANRGGLFANLAQNFSIHELVHGVIGILATWVWGGSWSLVRVSPVLQGLLLLVAGWIALNFVREARKYPATDPIWLPVWLTVPVLGGLFYHVLVVIALGSNGTPGWYLNIFAPFLATAIGYSVARIRRSAAGRIALSASLAYAVVLLAVVLWSQTALFAGCAIKNSEKYYEFAGSRFCLDRLGEIGAHLSIVGWPLIGLLAMAGGLLCFVIGSIADAVQQQSRTMKSASLPGFQELALGEHSIPAE